MANSFSPMVHFVIVGLLSYASDARTAEPGRYVSGNNTDIQEAMRFLLDNDRRSTELCQKVFSSGWNHATNVTEDNMKSKFEAQEEQAKFERDTWKKATSFSWKDFGPSGPIFRWFKKLSVLETAALPEPKLKELYRLVSDMETVHRTARVCRKGHGKENCDLSLEPDLTDLLKSGSDYDDLAYLWASWRNVSGSRIRKKYLRYTALANEAAKQNGFHNAAELWIEPFEDRYFRHNMEKLWGNVRPLYLQLHAYVRRKLVQMYPANVRQDGPIPAHLLRDMWGQNWENLESLVKPYPKKSSVDVTDNMKLKNMTPFQMFQTAEDFFVSLGMKRMPHEFWNRTIMVKPKDMDMICQPSAWDMCDGGNDVRIKMCAEVNKKDLIAIHREMTHIQYYLYYAKQPHIFRRGANPGFHEAAANAIGLSVSTPAYLKKLGLIADIDDDMEEQINYLLQMALKNVAFLPYSYLLDQWRWNVFNGHISKDKMNTKYWEMRQKYQGLCPPVKRTEKDFDPGAKYHVAASVHYIRYFVSTILQFQFYKSLCDEAGYLGPLHLCDISNSKKAGKLLEKMMSKGSFLQWREVMAIMTKGTKKHLDASSLLEYFRPLIRWLEEKNKKEVIGWITYDPTTCP